MIEIMEKVTQVHLAEFDSPPDVVTSAPGRFHLLGEHSWYFKDKTLSMAVSLPVHVAISVRSDSAIRCFFPQLRERKRSNLNSLKYRREDRWANSVKAMLAGFVENGFPCAGINVTIHSDVLPSAGFGITCAIKIATALAIRTLFAPACTDTQLLECILSGNSQFFSGLSHCADVFTALYARENTCILTDHETGRFEYLPFDFSDYTIVLTDARVPRVSVWDEETLRTPVYAQYLRDLKIEKNGNLCYDDADIEVNETLSLLNEDTRRRLVCIIREHQCVLDASDALRTQNFGAFSRSVNRSHEFMRDLYAITCPEIDWLVKRVQELDVSPGRGTGACARITGKGFGRCTYTIIKTADVETYVQKLTEYERIFGFHPSWYAVKPACGAQVLKGCECRECYETVADQ